MLLSGIEECNRFLHDRIKGFYLIIFLYITRRTGSAKIFAAGWAAKRTRANMIGFQGDAGDKFRSLAIFTSFT
jgi:hypothetical protein